MEEHFPANTPTLWRFEDSDPLFFGPNWDKFWSITVMRRFREELKNTDPKTLIRLVQELPAKMNEIYRLKGKKIPWNFDPRKSPHACKCSVCESWDLKSAIGMRHKIFENLKTFLKIKIPWTIQKITLFKKCIAESGFSMHSSVRRVFKIEPSMGEMVKSQNFRRPQNPILPLILNAFFTFASIFSLLRVVRP